jgi:hypothetical protein
MAFRIHESVVRGEIDNREKGIVRGRIWVHGRSEPVNLELKGNAHPDLAGCVLTFENPLKTTAHPGLDSLHPFQRGSIGDLTASRKVRVFDLPFEEAFTMIKRGEKPPEHMANSLYLEWFSEVNGRVVIESADYRVDISPPLWQLTPEENEQRATEAASGMAGFMQTLTEAVEAQRHKGPENIEEWDEFDYEKSLRESDAITEKYLELLQKYGDTPEAEALIAREMGWDQDEDDEKREDGGWDVDEINRICAEAEANPPQPDPLTEGVDWIRTQDGDIQHPLSHRALESVLALMHTLDELDLDKTDDMDLIAFVSEFQITSAKLAGALDGLGHDRDLHSGGFVVASLKRALAHLHKAQAGLEKSASRKLLPDEVLTRNRKDLFEIREDILRLMQEFRAR